jgi:hypothetical protein
MKWFTVEVTLTPVTNNDWALHMRAIDAVPGTLLIQDAEAPVLSFPVQEQEPLKAARFVEGVLNIVGLEAVSGEITDLPEPDYDLGDEEGAEPDDVSPPSDVVKNVRDWMAQTPPVRDGQFV